SRRWDMSSWQGVKGRSWVERSDQGLCGREAGEKIRILRGKVDVLLLDCRDGLLLLLRRARAHELLEVPLSVEAETVFRMLRVHVHGFVDGASLDSGDLCLVIRIADVD